MTGNKKQDSGRKEAKQLLNQDQRELNDECQLATWKISLEILSFSALLRNMGSCEMNDDEIYGLSLSLERLGKRLKKISDGLSKSILEEE